MADITALCDRVILIYAGQLIYDGRLEGLLERFAPYREVKVELACQKAENELTRYGEIECCEGQSVRWLVEREALTTTISRILAELDVVDLTVTDPPIEEVIGRVFQAGTVEESTQLL